MFKSRKAGNPNTGCNVQPASEQNMIHFRFEFTAINIVFANLKKRVKNQSIVQFDYHFVVIEDAINGR